jgi:hypothetical protein
MIVLYPRGGLGELLFQYCFARHLATTFGYALNAPGIRGFRLGGPLKGRVWHSPCTCWTGQWPTDALTWKGVDITYPTRSRIDLRGWFQIPSVFPTTSAEMLRSMEFRDATTTGKKAIVYQPAGLPPFCAGLREFDIENPGANFYPTVDWSRVMPSDDVSDPELLTTVPTTELPTILRTCRRNPRIQYEIDVLREALRYQELWIGHTALDWWVGSAASGFGITVRQLPVRHDPT